MGRARGLVGAPSVTIEEVLSFWFPDLDPELGTCTPEAAGRWFRKDPAFDAVIAEKFEPLLQSLPDSWPETPRGRLASILVLDQFPRNLYRGQARSFAYDAKALELCLEGMRLEQDRALALEERVFFYLPLEHSEDFEHQKTSLQRFGELVELAPAPVRQRFDSYLDYARRHAVIIQRFGRYPHRNSILGRPSSPEEAAFLLEPGSSFL